MKILFAMHFEPGHHLGTFRLAKELRSRGHSIAYLAIPALRALVENQGFQFVEFAGHLFPDIPSAPASANRGSTRISKQTRAEAETLFSDYTRAIIDGTLDKSLLSTNPDLLICDSFLWYVALRGLHLRIRTIQISTSLFSRDNSQIPPAITPITPRDGILSRIQILLAWKLMHLDFQFTKRLASRLSGAYRAPTRMHHLVDTFFWVAKRSNYPCRKNVTYLEDEIGAHLILPEVVLCPRAFQFPGNIPPGRTHCGDFIDFERTEAPLPFDPRDKTIILCSLGTSAGSYRYAAHFFTTVVKASQQARDWFFILHISDPVLIDRYESSPNLLVTKWLPQLSCLKHTSVMVNHGGLNSIMECVHYGVPMVILPCARDQPGNAARAAYRNLALTAKMETTDSTDLLGLITAAMTQPGLKAGLKKMREAIEREQGLEKAITLIETAPETQSENIGHPRFSHHSLSPAPLT
jgi:UDP:flavonoid glycosyltransferase YjiC (YdhE family)